jgi:polyphosphate kinase
MNDDTRAVTGRTVGKSGAESTPDPADLDHPSLYFNRELSWLAFNRRVLDQAVADYHPLLERVKFLAIVASNLDEFFMVRVATLLKKQRAGVEAMSVDGLTVAQQLHAVRQRATAMLKEQAACWNERLRPALAARGVRILEPDEYEPRVTKYLTAYFKSDIYPVLTPLAFDPGHPFPLISNRSKNLAVAVRRGRRTQFARVKIPDILPRFIPIVPELSDRGYTFVFLEDVVRMNLAALFPGMEIKSAHLFRIIRDTDMELQEDGAEDLLESVDRSLKRLRHGLPSLLQVDAAMPKRTVDILAVNFEVDESIVVRSADRMDFSDWMALSRLPLPWLKDTPFIPRALWGTADDDKSVFDEIREQDHLVHHPFESFSAVEGFLQQATTDPHVVGIKMTLYRIGSNSPIVDMLIEAADAGKQIAVLVELKARFDERNNIRWATRLEAAGVHVVYGVEGLKTHCKLCLVVRQEPGGVRRYAHIGTGNYNRATSQVYTDFGLFTADPAIVDDVSDIFNSLTGYAHGARHYQHLLVAPASLRARFEALVEIEIEHARAGRAAHMIIKSNAVTDPGIIRTLYRASQAGVRIDLICRGVCCLRPGIEGISETVTVRSVVGRFLEHSRAYYFLNGGKEALYVGSADLMERNLDRRVETLCAVRDPAIVRHLRDTVLEAYLHDTDRASILIGERYEPVPPEADRPRMSAQQELLNHYAAAAAPPQTPPND